MTHVAAAYLLRKPLRISKYTVIFFTGAILPDILTRPFYILLPGTYWFVYPLHTPFILILVCLLISYFFEERIRKATFLALLSGVFLHLFLDLFQKHLIGVNYWLFPFSDLNIEIGLFWQDDSVYAIPFLLALITIIKTRSFMKRNRKHKFINSSHPCQRIARPDHEKLYQRQTESHYLKNNMTEH